MWKFDPIKAIQSFNMMRFAATFLVGVILAKSGLPTGEISVYETWWFFGNIVTFFWMGGGYSALTALFPKLDDEASRRRLLFQAFALYTLLALAAAGFLVLGGQWLGQRFTRAEEIPYLLWLCIFVIGNTPSQLVQMFYLLREEPRSILAYGGLSFGLQIAAVAAPLLAGAGLEGVLISLAAWAAFKWLWLLGLTIKYGEWSVDFGLLRSYLLLMFPLTLHVLIGNSVEYIDGLIVANFFEDERQFALFRFGARELPLTMLLVGGLITGLVPVAARDMEAGALQIKARTAKLSHLLFPLSALLMFVSPWAFPWVYNADFSVSAQVFNIYLLILCSRILLPQVLMIARQRNYALVFSALFETALNIVLSLWWVRLWGLEGIAMASVVAFMVNKITLIAYNYWKLGISPTEYIPLRLWAGYAALLTACYILSTL